MWDWLKAIVQGIFTALFGVAADKIEQEVKQPSTMEDENTPKSISAPLRSELDSKLRDKNCGS